jgi:dipeptidyl aminopeptidase/acylaminoacyl peptidase
MSVTLKPNRLVSRIEEFMNKFLISVALSLAAFTAMDCVAQNKAPIPFEQFLKRDLFGTMKISPSGEFIAATIPQEDRSALVILRRSDMKVNGKVVLPSKTYVVDFNWVNPNRILFSVGEKSGELNQPRPTGELFGVNADGTGQDAALVGVRSTGKGTRLMGASIISTLQNDDDNVIISLFQPGGFNQVQKMNVNTGSRTTIARAPIRSASFVADPQGVVRFSSGANSDRRVKTYYRDDASSEWEIINDEQETGKIISAVGFNGDGKIAYLESEEKDGPNAVYAFDTRTKQRTLVARDNTVDPSEYLISPIDGSLYGIKYDDGKPRFEYIDPQNEFAKMHASLQAGLNTQVISPTSFTKDASMAIIIGYADNVPGDFYLYERANKKLTYLVSKNSWFKPEVLANMKPIYIVARDGTPLEGFLTIPVGSNGKNLPLIVNPHGGPFGPKDEWRYSSDVQILAANGYAVLQINFRGSGGYGRKFTHMGYKQWGRAMQDDLTDATLWAIKEGIANKNRVCMYGASYGGYSSIMAVAKEPDLYRCAFGNVGVYDMTAMYHTGDIPDSKSGENFLEEVLGHEDLDSISPDKLAGRIKAPVYLAAGREDFRAAPVHTELMHKALQRAGKQSEMVIYEGEGHGNFLLKNRIDFYQRLLGFLDKNIGPGSQAK